MLADIYMLGKYYMENHNELDILATDPKTKSMDNEVIILNIQDGKYVGYDIIPYSNEIKNKLCYRKLNAKEDATPTSKLQTNKPEKTVDRIFGCLKKCDKQLYESLINDKEKIINDIKSINYDKKTAYILTIKIDNKWISEIDKYITYMKERIYESFYYVKTGNVKSRGVNMCCLCNEEREVNGQFTELKWYTINNSSFSMFGDKNEAYKQFPICDDCALTLIAGKQVLDNELRIRMFGMNAWIIPHVDNIENLNGFMRRFKKFIEGYEQLGYTRDFSMNEQRLERFIGNENVLSYNIIFWEQGNDWKVLNVISDILPSRIKKLHERIKAVEEKYENVSRKLSKKPSKKQRSFLERMYEYVSDTECKGLKFRWFYVRDIYGNDYISIIKKLYHGDKIDMKNLIKKEVKYLQSVFRKNRFIDSETINKINIINDVIGDTMEITDNEKYVMKIGELVNLAAYCQYKSLNSSPIMNQIYNLSIDKTKLKKIYLKALSTVMKYRQKDKKGYGIDLQQEIAELAQKVNLDKISDVEISYWFAIGLSNNNINNNESKE